MGAYLEETGDLRKTGKGDTRRALWEGGAVYKQQLWLM